MKLYISPKARKVLLALFILTITALTGVDAAGIEPVSSWLEPARPGHYQVLSTDDGDTITVATPTGEEPVRLIGVDTPELHHPNKPVQCWAEEASRFTSRVASGQTVRLAADFQDDNRDLYGRLLRYVYLPDGTLLNAELIRRGHGFAYTLFPFEKKEEFRALERSTQAAGAGLWDSCQIEVEEGSKSTAPVKEQVH